MKKTKTIKKSLKTIKKTPLRDSCCECGAEAEFFHSCCGGHFEGIVDAGEIMFACEVCGKYVASARINEERRGSKFNLK